jgi:hypothetical protein
VQDSLQEHRPQERGDSQNVARENERRIPDESRFPLQPPKQQPEAHDTEEETRGMAAERAARAQSEKEAKLLAVTGLPVEVSNEQERVWHNDARRFARLLVSEIEVYERIR